ncbi:hypothetical protein OIU79_015690 [Salix purpurea]|uniref:Rhamnogalacturonan endolyase n=1 Tax=Salix purpurea TaxID=77065 RepID=A0A9Q0PCE7_SALPP|nr:hypothetical protein OIU79_015690 [Salix purpurea]
MTSCYNRYWDVVWSGEGVTRKKGRLDRLEGTNLTVVVETEEKVEISFTRMWNSSLQAKVVPLNFDKRYVMLRGSSGFYTYAIYEHLEGWPAFDLDNTRIVFKLAKQKFRYMAIADNRQRYMPLPEDRSPERGKTLAYPEAVLLVNPIEPEFKGEVDDKYLYSCESQDIGVHGTGGPLKQFLTSHVGPTTLTVMHSTHYAGANITMKIGPNEPWKKVYGPAFAYLNSLSDGGDPLSLWDDAKKQMVNEVHMWPYDFIASEDFPPAKQRGSVGGRLLVLDRYVSNATISAECSYVGLAAPGEVGSWQLESKGYQFWTKTDEGGNFTINGIRPGDYNLYAWVPGFIGEYKFISVIRINPGCDIDIGDLVYEPPRNGSTLWEIDMEGTDSMDYGKDMQRYIPVRIWFSQLAKSDYSKDWFFAQVTRKKDNATYEGTTWQIKFLLDEVDEHAAYKLRLALATANVAELEVRVNEPNANPVFSTGQIGKDNTIARHGIHGLYRLFNVDIPVAQLRIGNNTLFLTQTARISPFQGVMYDYIRLEGPPQPRKTLKEI